MATIEPRGQVPELYEKLLSFVGNQERIEEIKNGYPKVEIRKREQRQCRISFCKDISKEWIITTLSNRIADEEKRRFIELQKVCKDEIDKEIYSYFLYFSGILFLFTEEEYKDGLCGLSEFFSKDQNGESKIQKTQDSDITLLFSFMTTFID